MAILDIWSPIDMQSSPSNRNSYSDYSEKLEVNFDIKLAKCHVYYTRGYDGVVDNDIVRCMNVNPISVGTISWSLNHKILNLDSITSLY